MSAARSEHAATLLADGRVLVVGGTSGNTLASTEIYDPATGAWSSTGALVTKRSTHTATTLQNGKVLVAGGSWDGLPIGNAELYDPATGTWVSTGSIGTNAGRLFPTATLLPSGRVLTAGGFINARASTSADVFDPATGTWSTGGTLATARAYHTAALLADGRVMVAGGVDFNHAAVASAEVFYEGLEYDVAARPTIASATSPLSFGGALVLTGGGFRGIPGGSSGSSRDCSTDYPVVQLRSLANDQCTFLPPAAPWSDNAFASVPVRGFPGGAARATVFANGIPSVAKIIQVEGFTGANLVSVTPEAGGVSVRWREVLPGAAYRVQFLDRPTGSWQDLASPVVAGKNAEVVYLDATSPMPAQRLYRLVTPP